MKNDPAETEVYFVEWLTRRARGWQVAATFLGFAAIPYVVRWLFALMRDLL